MKELFISAVVFWLSGGLLAVLMSADRPEIRLVARLSMFVIWPWLFFIEKTPTMERWLDWAEGRKD